jgi:hypothetical protein
MVSNTENNFNNLNLTPEQKKNYRNKFVNARTQNEKERVIRNAKSASRKNNNINVMQRVQGMNRRDIQAVAEVANNAAGIVAKLIRGGYGNDAMAVLVFGLTRLVGSDRLLGNAIRSLPYMRPSTSARGPVNYAFKIALFELQKYFTKVQVPYLEIRERMLATYGPARASAFGRLMDTAVLILTFVYLAVRIGRFSDELMDVVRPSLSELYKRIQDKKLVATAIGGVLTFYVQMAQQQMLLNRQTIGFLLELVSREFIKRKNPTQTQVNAAIQTISDALQGMRIQGTVAPQRAINYVRENSPPPNARVPPPIVTSPGGTRIPMGNFETPPASPQRIRARSTNGNFYSFTRNQWSRLSNVQMATSPRNPVVVLTHGGKTKYALKSNLPTTT